MKEKKYRAWWQPLAFFLCIGFLLISIPDYFSGLVFQQWFKADVTLLFGFLTMIFLYARFTYIIFTLDGRIINMYVTFGHFRRIFKISKITKIVKIPLYFNLGWAFGYQLLIHYKQDDDTLTATEINLNNYKKETIIEILNAIIEINPNIKLDANVKKMIGNLK